jgi:hypothetical protein
MLLRADWPECAPGHVGVQDSPADTVSSTFLHVLPEVHKTGMILSAGGMPPQGIAHLLSVDKNGTPSENSLLTLVRKLEDAVFESQLLGKPFTKPGGHWCNVVNPLGLQRKGPGRRSVASVWAYLNRGGALLMQV